MFLSQTRKIACVQGDCNPHGIGCTKTGDGNLRQLTPILRLDMLAGRGAQRRQSVAQAVK